LSNKSLPFDITASFVFLEEKKAEAVTPRRVHTTS